MEKQDGGATAPAAEGLVEEGTPVVVPTKARKKKKRPPEHARPFSLETDLNPGQAAAWESIEETDLVAGDAGSGARWAGRRGNRVAVALSTGDDRDLDTVLSLLGHQGRAICGIVDVSGGLEARLQQLEAWQTEQVEAEVEARIEAQIEAGLESRPTAVVHCVFHIKWPLFCHFFTKNSCILKDFG